jgi:thiamine biosynthesis lipoprotein
VVTSGVYERFFEQDGVRYHHILDTQTGFPVNNELLSVTIIAGKSIEADALSTTTFLLGTEEGLKFIERMEGVQAVFINRKHEIRITPGLNANLNIIDARFTLVP